uniref:RNase H type-1 domain-containing protein n=1 Tax=Chenopodium quinoa TaxID=63459 RepID=A0A803N9T4_CHEQI
MWFSKPECHEVVKEAWEGNSHQSMEGRIAMCASHLRKWANSKFGNVKKKIGEKEKELGEWKKQVPDATMLEWCMEIVAELNELHRNEESFWHARARANELKDGDRNTSYFHHKASHRMQRNFIHIMEYESGVEVLELEALHTHLNFEDANVVKCIPLSCMNTSNLIWRFRLNEEKEELWNMIWNIWGPPKLFEFLWRACSGSMAALGRLVDHLICGDGTYYAALVSHGAGSTRAASVTNSVVSRNGWDVEGKLLAVAVCKEGNVPSVKMAEILAARRCILLAKHLGYKLVELECDALEVVQAI